MFKALDVLVLCRSLIVLLSEPCFFRCWWVAE